MTRILCIGHAVQDYVFAVACLPEGGHKFRATGFETIGGGPAANGAVAIARLGGQAMLAARLGGDKVGDEIMADLIEFGVDCDAVRRFPHHQSSLSSVMIDREGERMIINYRDPSMPTAPGWIDATLISAVDGILADTRWPEGARAGLALAKANAIPGVLDADDPVPDDPAILGVASHLAFSADGLRGLTGSNDLAIALRDVQQRYGAWCCVTDGAAGVLIDDGGTAQIKIASIAVEPVDTLGAGDIWHGAFALRLAQGADARQAVQFANGAAALKVSRSGGREGYPRRDEVDQFLAHQEPRQPKQVEIMF